MGVADLKYESSFMGFLKPRLKLIFEYVQSTFRRLTPNRINYKAI